MKRITFLEIALTLALSLSLESICYAGNAATYKMTVQQIQLMKSDGTWVTIGQPNQEIDIASVNAGATAASLVSDDPVPPGQYVNFKLLISENMTFSGSDGAHYTVNGGDVTIRGADANAASTEDWGVSGSPNVTFTETTESHTATEPADVSQEEVTARLDLDAGDADDYIEVYLINNLGNPLNVTTDSVISMSFDFDTQGTVSYINYLNANHIMFFNPPQEGTKFSITVDGTTTTLTESQMKIDF